MQISPIPISSQVSQESCRAQFLVPVTAQGENRAQASLERAQYLNPMVEVRAQSERAEDQPDDFFLQFDAVSSSTLLGSYLVFHQGEGEMCLLHIVNNPIDQV